jgi:DNA adenine methylase
MTIKFIKARRIIKMMKNIIKIPTMVKWAGGKKQLLEQFEPFFPKSIEKYIEPFVGGGAVAFYIIKKYNPKEVIISDINEELINAYNIIKNNVEELIPLLQKYKEVHNKEKYYETRAINPTELSDLDRAARFIYLNKTCFNGLYRVNLSGGFNVPMGKYVNPAICAEENLREISKLMKNVTAKVMSFEGTLNLAKEGDFIYCDPPYDPLKKDSFTTYTKGKFLENEQRQLAKVFEELHKKKCKVMLSNSDTNFIKDLYSNYEISFVKARRMINSNAANRGKINEVVITNY